MTVSPHPRMLYQCNIQTHFRTLRWTLRQLVGPIEVVSPEHSSDDRSHEFQIASQMNACIEFSKAEYARSHQSRIRTLHHFSSFIQICTKPEAFLAHQPKIQDISTLSLHTVPIEGIFFSVQRLHGFSPGRSKLFPLKGGMFEMAL